jgi:hypothetical protein
MKQEPNKGAGRDREIDVNRSEHQQSQQLAGHNATGAEERGEGSKNKGTPQHHHGDHEEGQYTKQSDDPGMHPSNADDDK